MPQHVQVYDEQGNVRSIEWAQQRYGFSFQRADVPQGSPVYRLVEVHEKRGQTTHIATVINESLQPIPNVQTCFYWPDAPVLQDFRSGMDWENRGHLGPTNHQGNCGNGMGHGAYPPPGKLCGPHKSWIRDINIPSDVHECIGMLDNHAHLNSVFMRVIEGSPDPNPDPPQQGYFRAVGTPTWQAGSDNKIVVGFSGRDHLDLMGTMDVQNWQDPEGPPPWKLPTPIKPSANTFEFNTPYNPGEGEEHRVFRVYILDIDQGLKVVGGPYPVQYNTGVTGIWTMHVEWVPEGAPVPDIPDIPEDMGIADTLRMISNLTQRLANLVDRMLT